MHDITNSLKSGEFSYNGKLSIVIYKSDFEYLFIGYYLAKNLVGYRQHSFHRGNFGSRDSSFADFKLLTTEL